MKKNPLTGFVFIKNERWKLFLAMRLTIVIFILFHARRKCDNNGTIPPKHEKGESLSKSCFRRSVNKRLYRYVQ